MTSTCPHYVSKCDIKSPCCQEFFPCRICHDTQKNEEEKDYKKRHTINRYEIPAVRCRDCQTEQVPEKSCISCGVEFASYFCKTCRLYESNPNKDIYHCEGCNICRIGPQANFFHCYGCEACLAKSMENSHKCRSEAMKQDCPICLENMFFSRESSTVLKCGHYVHSKCYKTMIKNRQYQCPSCLKYVFDLDEESIKQLDEEIKNTPMPEELRNMVVKILCNECGGKTEVGFHIFGLKCQACGNYNTRRID